MAEIDEIVIDDQIKEFHLFAGIGGGIYGGKLLGHRCVAGVEIDEYCQSVLKQRQVDGWLEPFDVYGDIFKLNGKDFENSFDVLCGGFPCQAFSTAAHGRNILDKNIWPAMYQFVQASNAPVVFGENVVFKAISQAKSDLEKIRYRVECCKLGCYELGADHQRNRFWLLAVKDEETFQKVVRHLNTLSKLKCETWVKSPNDIVRGDGKDVRRQLKAVGNAQSPFVAATAFRVLANRLNTTGKIYDTKVSKFEIEAVFDLQETWIKKEFGKDFGLVHTPTTMANYSAPSMMKHQGCRNFIKVFGRPAPLNAEYLMGFPMGASSSEHQPIKNLTDWHE